MKLYNCFQYGAPEKVLRLEDNKAPVVKDNEVLIQTEALSINPAEWHQLTASFWLLRLSTGLFKPKASVLGADIAGRVVAVGKNVTKFSKGDPVFGRASTGGLAEYCCMEELAITRIPDGIPYLQAAAIPLAAVTALIALRNKGHIKANQKVLINGASGGIGTFAIQLAKYFEAHVTGICSTKNVELVKSLGADKVIDYKKQNIQVTNLQFDLIIDLVGNMSANTFFKLLNPNGRCVFVGMDTPKRLFSNLLKGVIFSMFGRKKFLTMDTKIVSDDLTFLSKLVVEEKIRVVIDEVYDFESLPEALTRLGTRRSRGKIVIKL